ncbi:hypothetical protein [Azospirillum halopraeferens]|uniref:hypothetical protein n=1 Tax=Azospirillum halopraeferens TaxID=34010 RepID=UPI0012EB7889|nr:hypothetical protein [Azospirillum halopraeferens]
MAAAKGGKLTGRKVRDSSRLEAHRQSPAVAASTRESADQAFIDAESNRDKE